MMRIASNHPAIGAWRRYLRDLAIRNTFLSRVKPIHTEIAESSSLLGELRRAAEEHKIQFGEFPTPDELRQAAFVIQRWIATRKDDTSQEVTMARYTADNMAMTALALEHTEP